MPGWSGCSSKIGSRIAGRLERVGEGLVGRQRGDVERQGIEDSRLAVIRIGQGQALHRLLVGKRARAMIDRRVVGVEGVDGRDVESLALGRGTDGERLLDSGSTVLDPAAGRRPVEGVVEPGHRRSPVGHAACGIRLGSGGERLPGRREPERVEPRHTLGELGLGGRVARDREGDVAHRARVALVLLQLFLHIQRLSATAPDESRAEGQDRSEQYVTQNSHDFLLASLTQRRRASGVRHRQNRPFVRVEVAPVAVGRSAQRTVRGLSLRSGPGAWLEVVARPPRRRPARVI